MMKSFDRILHGIIPMSIYEYTQCVLHMTMYDHTSDSKVYGASELFHPRKDGGTVYGCYR